ncbi:DoxX family membrane protein [Rhodococcus chondri]
MLASIFIAGGIDALRSPAPKATAAQPGLDKAVKAMPAAVTDRLPSNPETLVQINAAVQIGAGALFAIGKAPRLSALALAGTLVPTTVAGHDFWSVQDPASRAQQRTQFIKNVSLMGGLLIAAVDTEGKPSLGWRGRRAARTAQQAVAAALPAHSSDHRGEALGEGLHTVAERVKALTGDATEQGSHLLDIARERAPELAEVAKERGSGLLEVARERAPELAERARERGTGIFEIAKDRGPELAERARERGTGLLEIARERAPELTDGAKGRGRELRVVAMDRGPELAELARQRGSQWLQTTLDHSTELAHRVEAPAAVLNARALENAHRARVRAELAREQAEKALAKSRKNSRR